MAGSGAGWPSLDASWGISLEMASCTGADAEYGVMTFVVFGLYTNTVASFGVFVQFANILFTTCFFHQTFSFQFRGLPAVLQGALQCWQRRDLHCQLHSDGRHICQR